MPGPLRLIHLWHTLGAVLIGLVIYQSLTPHPIAVPIEHGDKYGHVLAYSALMLWYSQIYAEMRTRLSWAIGFIAMGVGLEFLQGLTDYRTFEVADMVADACGVGIGWLAAPPRLPNALRFIEGLWYGP